MTPLQKSEQIADIQAGIDEADRGEFATAAEVAETLGLKRRHAYERALAIKDEASEPGPQ